MAALIKANPVDQTILTKDSGTFAQVYTSIETKKYRKAIQIADSLLSRYPTNGELATAKGMCMATVASRGDDASRDAGIKLMKQGIMWNIKSSRSWTVQGHYYRNDKQYAEALKCYTQVTKLLPLEGATASNDFLRDMSTVQAQLGRWEEYVDTRRQLIVSASNYPQLHWPGFALGCHLSGRFDVAIEALNSYQNLHRTSQLGELGKNKPTIEESELCLYRVEIFYQKGDFEAALASLLEHQPNIMDLIAFSLYQVRLLILLGKLDEAKVVLTDTLLARNTDQLESVLLFFKASGVNLNDVDMANDKTYTKVNAIFQTLLTAFPKSSTIIKLSLQYFSTEDAEAPLTSYIQPALSKGVPSLFKTLKSLYTSQTIATFIETLLLSYVTALTTTQSFPHSSTKQSPTTILSTYVYLAQHYDYFGQFDKALSYLDLAEKHTPTFIDLYVYRAKVYKHIGNHHVAYYWIDYARQLDLADRWLNNKCSVYAYQAGHDDQGERTIGVFIKETRGTYAYQYHEQASWWFYQTGLYHLTYSKHYPLALKFLASVDDFFTQYQESVFDYHQYCVRKALLRAYTGMLNYLNCAKTHKFYLKAILPLINALNTMQHQVNFERRVAGDVTEYATATQAPTTLSTQLTTVEAHYKQRPAHQWRLDYIETRNKKRQQDEEAQVNEAETENAGQMTQNPNYDVYGEEYFASTLGASKFTKNDFTAFATEATRYINLILANIKSARDVHSKQSNVSSEIQNDAYLHCPPGLLFLSVESNVLTAHPLRALQHLTQATTLVDTFKAQIGQARAGIVSVTPPDQILKSHHNGVLPWFQIKSSTPQVKLLLLPTYYTAQLFIAQMMVSTLCANEPLAISHMNKNEAVIAVYKKQYQKALDTGVLVTDVAAAINHRVVSALDAAISPCVKIITLASALLAAYYTQATGVSLDEILTTLKSVVESIPVNFDKIAVLRAPLQSLVFASNLALGTSFKSSLTQTIPLITGLVDVIQPEQCTTVTAADQVIVTEILNTALAFGRTHFIHSPVFMNAEQLTALEQQFPTPAGPDFITPPEKAA